MTDSAPVLMVEGVATTARGSAKFAVSRNGVLAYVPGPAHYEGGRMVWAHRDGRVVPLPFEPPVAHQPRISPDGAQWAAEVLTDGQWHIWTFDLETGSPTRLTRPPNGGVSSAWTSTGDAVAFVSGSGLFRRAANGTGTAEELLAPNGTSRWRLSGSDDGRTWVFQESSREAGFDILVLSTGPTDTDEATVPQPLIGGPGDQTDPVVSPSGRLIAYESNESGNSEVYVNRFPGLGSRTPISVGGGAEPLWAPSGEEVFYRSGDSVMAVAVFDTGAELTHDAPVKLFSGAYGQNTVPRHWGIHPDGNRFLMRERHTVTEIRVVTGWFEELRERVPTY